MTERTTIVGVFQNRAHAQQAINELKRAGFRDDEIGVTSRDERHGGRTDLEGDEEESYAAEGGATGLAAGAGLGALWGLGIVSGLLPAIGPAIAGGTLAAILSSAAAGAVAAGLAGTLVGLGIPKEEAEYYESEFKAGRTIVTVKTTSRQGEALAIIRRHGGYDMSTAGQREPTTSTARRGTSPVAPGTMAAAGGDRRMQAVDEELHVEKERRQGEVRVRKEVHTEHKTLDVPVEREEVVIERHPVSGGRPATGAIGEGEEIRVPVSEEHVHVEKTPVVKEEVTVGKRKTRDTEHVEGTVRKEDIKVEQQGDANVRQRNK